jgi:hypothetical protein
MALLGREDILKANDRPTETVPVPEWGGEVLVRGCDGHGRDEYFASMTILHRDGRQGMNSDNATAKLVARCIIDPDTSEPMFSQQDVDALGRKSGAALDRVFTVAQRLSGLTEEDMEDLGKVSVIVPNDSSISPSPATSARRSKSS